MKMMALIEICSMAAWFSVTYSFPFVSNSILEEIDKIQETLQKFEAELNGFEKDLREKKWTKFNDHCYYFGDELMTWPSAQRACQQIGGYLVKIDDSSEDNFLKPHVKNIDAWIGLTSLIRNEERWIYDQQIAAYEDFRSSEPNGTGPCWVIESDNGQWYDRACADKYKFICENNICV